MPRRSGRITLFSAGSREPTFQQTTARFAKKCEFFMGECEKNTPSIRRINLEDVFFKTLFVKCGPPPKELSRYASPAQKQKEKEEDEKARKPKIVRNVTKLRYSSPQSFLPSKVPNHARKELLSGFLKMDCD